MCFDNISAVDLSSSDGTVVRALRTRVTALGPAIWPAIRTKQGVFLFETEPYVLFSVGLHQPSSVMPVIEFIRASVVVPGFTQNEDVVTTAEGIRI